MPIISSALIPDSSRWRTLSLGGAGRHLVLIGSGIVTAVLYAAIFAFPKTVNFSYAASTCIRDIAVLPTLQRPVGSSDFKEVRQGELGVGKLQLASTQLCFVPTRAPQPGVAKLANAPFGGWLLRKQYNVSVGEGPRLLAKAPLSQALAQPLTLELNEADKVFNYTLEVDGKTQPCSVSNEQLLCVLDKLGLQQGAVYAFELQRSFEGKNTSVLSAVQVTILPATKVTAASVAPDQIIYTKLQSAQLTLDKPVKSAATELLLLDGNTSTAVNTQVTLSGAQVQIAWASELPREKSYRIVLTAATAMDGSTLDGPFGVGFSTSGGPKVISVSIGNESVPGNAQVVATFDQAIAPGQSVGTLASISGGAATISRLGTTKIVFALHDMPVCGAFTLSIAKGLVGSGGIVAQENWSQVSRISCETVRTIGYSVQGRPIQAYFFGAGATTVLFTGGIHGNEPSGTYLMQDWVAYLDANAYKLPPGKQVVVVPELNPDGIAANQRYNTNNVNIDRNFPTSDWISDITSAGGVVVPHGGGTAPLSEPETRAITELVKTLTLRAEISFHASGALVGANKVADSVAIGSQYAAALHYGTVFVNPEATFGYTLTGEFETWLGEQFSVPAILIELPTANGRYFNQHLGELWNLVNL